ncbi:MAG: chromosome condensation regulator RCC1 [Burkholderiales bacterium PBB3]|nr:MAG: chromosome condensation regulator RCC1 [Burkholderiales bacterium PBB3]
MHTPFAPQRPSVSHVFKRTDLQSGQPVWQRAWLLLGLVLMALVVQGRAWAQTPLDNIAQVAVGGSHSCALTKAGGVKCWGENTHGELGDGTVIHRAFPVDVTGLTSGVTAIAVGVYHSCAVTTAGVVKCWGYNSSRQLGDGTTTSRSVPVNVNLTGGSVVSVGAGQDFTCAVTAAGDVKCWGANFFGQLGAGNTTARATVGDVVGLSGVTSISVGGSHSCAVTNTGAAKCWGYNGGGGLGDNSLTTRSTPVTVSGLATGVAAVAVGGGGAFSCALTTAGGVKCWGVNMYGPAADMYRLTPADVPGMTSGITAITKGAEYTCALTSGGGVKCWGFNNSGRLGDNTTTNRIDPVDVVGLGSGVVSIAAGPLSQHTCAVTSAGTLKCWGLNAYGALGDGTETAQYSPATVLASAATVVNVNARADCFFRWAEASFPQFFPPTATSVTIPLLYYRYYPSTRTYLAVLATDSRVYAMGPVTADQPVDLGLLDAFLPTAGCQ